MKAYLIPGSGEDLNSRDYNAILNLYRQHGYEPEFLPVTWKYRTIDNWVKEVERHINKSKLDNCLLSGFSWGAMIALCVAAKANPKQLLLFSLSPYFQEDMPLPPKYEEWAGKRRIDNFKKLSFDELAKQIHCPTTLFLGSIEKERYKETGWKRTSAAHQKIAGSKLFIVDGAAHDATHPNYLAAIERAL